MPFFNVCSYQERYFYEGWQRETGLTAYEMCQVLEKQRDDDERRAWEDHLWEGEQSSKWEDDEMAAREAEEAAGQAAYARRKAVVEPVFGVLKQQRGMRQFRTRGLQNVNNEFTLATLAFNITRLKSLMAA